MLQLTSASDRERRHKNIAHKMKYVLGNVLLIGHSFVAHGLMEQGQCKELKH